MRMPHYVCGWPFILPYTVARVHYVSYSKWSCILEILHSDYVTELIHTYLDIEYHSLLVPASGSSWQDETQDYCIIEALLIIRWLKALQFESIHLASTSRKE